MYTRLVRLFEKNRFALIASLFLLLEIGYYFLLRSMNIGQKPALYETITSFILILFFSFILQRIHTYYHSRSAISIVHVSIIMVFSLLSTLFIHEYGKWIMTNDNVYENFIKSSFYLRWFVLFLIFLTVVNQLWIDKHLLEQRNSFNRLIEKEKLLAKAEMNNLQQQFQPHFLFNSLNSINALVKSEPDQARQMIHNLSDYLRLTIQKGKEELIPLKEEMDYLNLYLEIEKVRFGHRLKINSSVDPICSDMMLPSLILQPIVENAIKYGVYGSIGELSIDISIRCQNNALIIAITNPYDETAVSSSKGTGFGLESIQRKLALVYKRMDLLKTAKTATQFETTLFIPQK